MVWRIRAVAAYAWSSASRTAASSPSWAASSVRRSPVSGVRSWWEACTPNDRCRASSASRRTAVSSSEPATASISGTPLRSVRTAKSPSPSARAAPAKSDKRSGQPPRLTPGQQARGQQRHQGQPDHRGPGPPGAPGRLGGARREHHGADGRLAVADRCGHAELPAAGEFGGRAGQRQAQDVRAGAGRDAADQPAGRVVHADAGVRPDRRQLHRVAAAQGIGRHGGGGAVGDHVEFLALVVEVDDPDRDGQRRPEDDQGQGDREQRQPPYPSMHVLADPPVRGGRAVRHR